MLSGFELCPRWVPLNQAKNQSLKPLTDAIQLILTLKMTTAQVLETSLTVSNSPVEDNVHPDDHAQPTPEITRSSNLSQNVFFSPSSGYCTSQHLC